MFIYLVIFLCTLLCLQSFKKINYFKKRGIPYETQYPFKELTFFINRNQDGPKNRKKYGSFYGTFLGNLPMIIVSDPEIAKEVTIKQAQNFTDSNSFKLDIKYFKEIFMLKKGKAWKDGRSIVSPVFTTKKIKEIFSKFQLAAMPLFENIDGLINEGKQDEIDIKVLFKNYGLDVIAKFVYCIDINSAKEKENIFVKSVLKMIDSNLYEDLKFFFAFVILPTSLRKKLNIEVFDEETTEYFAGLTKSLIKQRKENPDQTYNDFLDQLLKTMRQKGTDVPDDEIIGLCMLFFFAGLETVSMTLSNALYCLILNPECQVKLYEELSNLFANGEIDYDQMNESPYLDAVLKESQRIFPALNMIMRIADNPVEINGLQIQANDIIAIDIYTLHNSPDFWENPEQFRPERFLEKDINFENDDIFKPFGSGIRSCIASRFALMQVKYVLAKIILKYEVYRSEKTSVPPKYRLIPTQLAYSNMILGFKKREN